MTRIFIFLVIIMLGSEKRISARICLSLSSNFKEDLIRLCQSGYGHQSNHYIFKCVITEYLAGNEGARVKVLDQYLGTIGVVQDSITIRNDDGIGCLGSIPLTNLDDTLIASVYRIDANFHPYQQPPLHEGEFVTDLCLWSFMPILNDSVYGWTVFPDLGFPLPNLKDSIDHFFNNLLSIGDEDKHAGIDVYLNPGGDLIRVETHGTDLMEAMLYDVSGRCLITEPIISGRAIMNIQQLTTGSYLVRCTDKKGHVYQKEVVKQ